MWMVVNLAKRLNNDPNYAKSYSDFMTEYERLHHMTPVPDSEPEPQYAYYLPHHGVIRESSLTTKLRVVFNGSSRTTTGVSLNDVLHKELNFKSICSTSSSGFACFTTFFLRMWKKCTAKYRYILRIRFFSLVVDEGEKYPRAGKVLRKVRYVNDVFGGGDSVCQAQDIVKQLTQLCMAGGFPFQKWVSNHPAILESVPPERKVESSSVQIEDATVVHALGLWWKPSMDTFHFTINLPPTTVIIKRSILSTIAKLFDPLGLISPVIITAKILIQELWSNKLDLDDPLPQHLSARWIQFIDQLPELSRLTFPRWLSFQSDRKAEIHGFCDASQLAISAVVYIRLITTEGEILSSLICSKTKVAPLKRLTIPRLELSGAVMLTKLVAYVLLVLEMKNTPVYMWTDSAITYIWINGHPSRWKDFVQNRVCFIQETLPQSVWKFVPGKDNPADCTTRGLIPLQLSEHSQWWTGLQWLQRDLSAWPQLIQSPSQKDNLEERPTTKVSIVTRIQSAEPWNLLDKYSSLTRLLRITVWCLRAVSPFKKSSDSLTGPITTHELEAVKSYWVKTVQRSSFQQELTVISEGQALPKSNPLSRLTPFTDSNGLLRIGGRLQSSLLPTTTKYPLILPRKSSFTSLIISDAHLRTMHGGTQVTLAFIRNEY
ncbi:uncharacterized protein LOC105281490 [Ooceraea biroi]|uniref:uncharacterized protein LOC105281490 n=1 Tax=Ooceraea biroi TaxID=2015173 RepID=UPI0005BB2361|nr:uncharacterized protein LOC105281490 [Ooceraea biroi]